MCHQGRAGTTFKKGKHDSHKYMKRKRGAGPAVRASLPVEGVMTNQERKKSPKQGYKDHRKLSDYTAAALPRRVGATAWQL